MNTKPFSRACENNKLPIAEVLAKYLGDNVARLLEIGSGTGQHGAYMCERFPNLQWQCSDRIENHAGIRAWVDDAQLDNFLSPIELDVNHLASNIRGYNYLFSANTAHIMAWSEVVLMFECVPQVLIPKGLFFLYGPFNYGGRFTSESNARFDLHLKEFAEHMGIRDFEQVDALAKSQGLKLIADHEMPANNRLLVWELQGEMQHGSI